MSNEMPLYPRDMYLNKIRPFRDDCGIIKVLVGVRRCGKSSIMELIRRELMAEKVPENNIAFLNLDRKENIFVKTKSKLMKKIDSSFKNSADGKKYLFIDEVQNVKNFETVINAYREEGDYSIFITGSNGYLLSGNLSTKLTGRYIEFNIGTLLFPEYLAMKQYLGKEVNMNDDIEFNNYIIEGGFPKAIEYDDPIAKKTYVKSIIDEIYERDIMKNKKIKNMALFQQIQQYVINNFGATFSARSLAESLMKSNHVKHSIQTIYNYLSILENAKIISKCKRFDLKSKKSLVGEEKFYLTDLSFYFAMNTDKRVNYGPVLENIIYNYARLNGYEISIGKIGKTEVDFILNRVGDSYAYVQVCKTIDNGIYDENGKSVTEEREYRPLEMIRDNYPKYVLTMDRLTQNRNGIINANLIDFMKHKKEF